MCQRVREFVCLLVIVVTIVQAFILVHSFCLFVCFLQCTCSLIRASVHSFVRYLFLVRQLFFCFVLFVIFWGGSSFVNSRGGYNILPQDNTQNTLAFID